MANPSGIVTVDEASLVARRRDGTVAALGDEAAELLGREPDGVQVARAASAGRVHDPAAAVPLLAWALSRAGGRRPRVVAVVRTLAVRSAHALETALRAAGAADVVLLPTAAAAAAGLGLDVREPVGNLFVDIGAGLASATLTTAGEVVAHVEGPFGGDGFVARVGTWLREAHGLDLGGRATEALTLRLAAARPPHEPLRMRVRGRDIRTGTPREAEVGQAEAVVALREDIAGILRLTRDALTQAPPELAADIANRGAFLFGGASRLRHLDEVLRDYARLPFLPIEGADHLAVRGAARLCGVADTLADLAAHIPWTDGPSV